MEDEQGQAIHTYLAEAQLMQEAPDNNRHSSLDELAKEIKQRAPRLQH